MEGFASWKDRFNQAEIVGGFAVNIAKISFTIDDCRGDKWLVFSKLRCTNNVILCLADLRWLTGVFKDTIDGTTDIATPLSMNLRGGDRIVPTSIGRMSTRSPN